LKYNHDRLPTFAVGKDRRPTEWRSIFRQLSASGLIQQDFLEHGRWTVTEAGWQVLKGSQRIELRKETAAPKSSRREKRAVALAAVTSDADATLLAALKGLRAKLAQAQRVPAYVVFSDRTLIELATHRPDTLRVMREIHGVGDAKLERYGSAFLEVIQDAAR